MTVPTTEFESIDVDEVHLVGKAANGFSALLMKAAADEVEAAKAADGKVDCPTCDGDGKILNNKRKCPDCGGDGKVSQEKADELGKSVDEYEQLIKAKYKADDLKAMADKGVAMKNDNGDPSYPIADAEDLTKAIKAVGRGNADHDAIRKHIIARAAALKLSSEIPDNWNADGSLKAAAKAAGDDVPTDDGIPGSKTWEAADAARLAEASQMLLDLKCLLEAAAEREQIEGQTVDPDDMQQAWSLQDACYMLTNVLGCVAAMAAIEQHESDNAADPDSLADVAGKSALAKAGARLSAKTKAALVALRDQATELLGDDDPAPAEKEIAVTKEELFAFLDERDAAKAASAAEPAAVETEAEIAAKADKAAAVKAEQETIVKTVVDQVGEVVAKTVEQAVQPLVDRLATVERMAAPGGPSKTRAPADIAKADQRDILDLEAADYERKADSTQDRDLRNGYLEKAREVRIRQAAITAA
jgi:hypothetical protein